MADANQGQRAFEMAEAGIEVSKARLAGAPDLAKWSSGELHFEGVDDGSVIVTIERQDARRVVATSTGQYGSATRKIEATFDVVNGEPTVLVWREVYE